MRLLVNKSANVNAQGGGHDNVLQAVLAEGHKATVKLLLKKSANFNAEGEEYDNPTFLNMLIESD